MIKEKWKCTKCSGGAPCIVEIHYEETELNLNDRFRGHCVCGRLGYPEERFPEWVKVVDVSLDGIQGKLELMVAQWKANSRTLGEQGDETSILQKAVLDSCIACVEIELADAAVREGGSGEDGAVRP